MANGIIKVLGTEERPFYDHKDLMNLFGVSRSKAYSMITVMRKECLDAGMITKAYPTGRIPKKYVNKMCMIDECEA